jgi:hypothetical protein
VKTISGSGFCPPPGRTFLRISGGPFGEGTIGAEVFRRLLHDERFRHAAFVAETPVDAPGDEARNVGVLRALAAG